MKNFFKNNINATLLSVIIILLAYINNSNQKAMDKLIENTEKLQASDIEQDILIVINKKDIKSYKAEIAKLQEVWYKYNKVNGKN